jgi:hypothetical protein
MMVTLTWATVNLPFVYQAQQEIAKEKALLADENNPFASSTEEKCSNTSFNEEYLHHDDNLPPIEAAKLSHDHYHSFDVYIAFHGELISPPPDSFLS